MESIHPLEKIVDLERYPLHMPESSQYQQLIKKTREGLRSKGCSVIPNFLRPEALDEVQRETTKLAPQAYFSKETCNPYSTSDDESLPVGHPVRMFFQRANGFVSRDKIPADTIIKKIYHDDSFKRLLATCLEQPVVYEYADPLAGLVVSVINPGCEHTWHFDTNEFIVSMMTQKPEAGGIFEYCPNIRTPESENYDRVGKVLRREDTSEVNELSLQPGDLQLFKGRFSLHRVTKVEGSRQRHTVIFAYAKSPGVIGKSQRSKQLFGRVTEEHLQSTTLVRDDGLSD